MKHSIKCDASCVRTAVMWLLRLTIDERHECKALNSVVLRLLFDYRSRATFEAQGALPCLWSYLHIGKLATLNHSHQTAIV